MATSTSPLKVARPGLPAETERPDNHRAKTRPQLIRLREETADDKSSLRMYTEEQVAEFLQVSLSKLRKWRIRSNDRKEKGPPFKKIGRLVRYPETGLLAYVNGD